MEKFRHCHHCFAKEKDFDLNNFCTFFIGKKIPVDLDKGLDNCPFKKDEPPKIKRIYPLDIVITNEGLLAIVSCVSHDGQASLEYIGDFEYDKNPYKTIAWWKIEDLRIIDSLPALLSRCSVSCTDEYSPLKTFYKDRVDRSLDGK